MGPYYRNVRTTAKGRWYGRRLADIVPELGRVARVNGDLEHVVVPHDTLEYVVHVHEPPVPEPEDILYDCRDYVVINKPSGIPVHPTVNYFRNSVTEKLQARFGRLYPCYRLDRLTSGVLILSKTAQFASEFHQRKDKHKKYFARTLASCIPSDFSRAVLTDPIVTFNGKRGYQSFLTAWKQAKPATTIVELVCKDAQFAVLQCEPITGRTHQIRKHLALNGMPIHNDEVYADGGLFRKLCQDPTESNFLAVWNRSESERMAKLTGENCNECGSPLYDSEPRKLDLHCAEYGFEDVVHKAPAAWFDHCV